MGVTLSIEFYQSCQSTNSNGTLLGFTLIEYGKVDLAERGRLGNGG